MQQALSRRGVCNGVARGPALKTLAVRPTRVTRLSVVCGALNEGKPLPKSEDARKYFRTVYDFPQWEKHRSNFRFIERLLQTPRSHILQNCLPIITWVMGVATALMLYTKAQAAKQLPNWLPSLAGNPAFSTFIAQTSVALSLLLVFRTNAAYGRWDEARKLWGGLLNRSRDLARQAVTCFPDECTEAKKTMCRWIVANARILRLHFQPDAKFEDDLKPYLTDAELAYMAKAVHRPVKAMQVLSQVIQNVPMSDIHQFQMSQNITFFQDVLGGSERLLRAPIPVSYTRHTARFLFVWLTLLPFALLPTCGWSTVPVVGAVAAVLAGIEEIGVQVEEPFGVLPLDVICKRIEADVNATMNEDVSAKAILESSMAFKTVPVSALN